jgi:hypothetical protein
MFEHVERKKETDALIPKDGKGNDSRHLAQRRGQINL